MRCGLVTAMPRILPDLISGTVGGIAERLALESSTVTPLVKRLEAAGLVGRVRNPKDERQVQVQLSARGHAIREECGCLGEALLVRSGMALADVASLNARVKALRDALADQAA